MARRAFISFQMEDRVYRDFLKQQARDNRNDIEFEDYSVQNPFDNAWKTQCRERIMRTRGTIVLVGDTTYQSEAVKWEIAETRRQEHYLFGIWIHTASRPPVPEGLAAAHVIPWDFDRIIEKLNRWV